MKKLTLLTLLLAVGFKGIAQKIDWVNAPMNPIALKYKKEHFNLKGDVYAYGQKVFSKQGMLIYEYGISKGMHYLYRNGLLYADTEGKLYEFNNQGFLIKNTYASLGIQTQRYAYNEKGLLTNLSNTKGYNVTYNYDERGRLIKSNTGGVVKEFSYQKNGDQLIVIEKDLSKNPVLTTKYIYKNGVEIGSNDKLFNLKYDKFGNKDAYESAIYYGDVENRSNEISVIYTKRTYASSDPLFNCAFYINGQKADFLYKEVLQRKDIAIYNPFTEKYYIIENAFDDAKSGQKQVFTKILVNSPYALRNSKGSSPKLGYKGAFLGNTTNGMRDGALKVYNAPIFLVYDKTLNQTFYGDLDIANTSGYFPLQPISPQDNVVYLKTGDNQFVIVIEGKLNAKENPTHKLISLKNGAGVIKDEKDNPIYYLPGTAKAALNKLYPGKKFNPATDKLELANNTATTPTVSPASSVKTIDAGSQSRLYNGKYTKETALIAINKYIANLKKIGTFSFVGGTTRTYQIDGIWTQKITEQDNGTVNIRYTIGDNDLTIELISAILVKNGKAIMLYAQSPNETVRKLYNNQVAMFVSDLFSYLGIKQNIVSTTTNTTTSSNNALSKASANYLNTYKNNPKGTSQLLQQLYQQWVNEKYSTQQIVNAKADMIKEVYSVDKDAAFDIVMKMNKSIEITDVFSKLSEETRLFIKQKAREKISKAGY